MALRNDEEDGTPGQPGDDALAVAGGGLFLGMVAGMIVGVAIGAAVVGSTGDGSWFAPVFFGCTVACAIGGLASATFGLALMEAVVHFLAAVFGRGEPALPPEGMNVPGWLRIVALVGTGVGVGLAVAWRHH